MIIPIASGGAAGVIGLLGMVVGLCIGIIALAWYRQDRLAVRNEMRAAMTRLEALVAEVKAYMPKTPEDYAALEARITPIVDRMIIHGADAVLQRVGPIIDERIENITKEIAGIVSGSIGLLLEAKQQGIQYERINEGRMKGLQTRKMHGFTNQAARVLAQELDPSGGVIAGKLLDVAEKYGIEPDEALQLGMNIMDKYPQLADKLGPALSKAGSKIKKVAEGAPSVSNGGGWG